MDLGNVLHGEQRFRYFADVHDGDRVTFESARFPTVAAFANYHGSAPVQIASADTDLHRLSRYGDRQLNSAL